MYLEDVPGGEEARGRSGDLKGLEPHFGGAPADRIPLNRPNPTACT